MTDIYLVATVTLVLGLLPLILLRPSKPRGPAHMTRHQRLWYILGSRKIPHD